MAEYTISAPLVPSEGGARSLPATHHKHIWFVTGPAGCGKTTAAASIAQGWGLPYLEGDTFHPPTNIAKMAAGHPLTDADRWSWLATLRTGATATLGSAQAVVLTCSALKKSYRDALREAQTEQVKVHFLYLSLAQEELVRRVAARQGHYMKADMVRSQLDVLQEPDGDEVRRDSVVVDAGRDFVAVEAEVRLAFERIMEADRV
ncbi:hypothetical protein ANO11243_040970 [Dothideomycetidae sp. 11243]|nr:hypothetical protein ANO11243_040970 [fungal sp. No.11243]